MHDILGARESDALRVRFLKQVDDTFSSISQDATSHAYRFLWRGGLYIFHLTVGLIINPDQTGQVEVSTHERHSGIYTLIETRRLKVSKNQVSRFIEYLNNASFWDMPTDDYKLGADGETWYLEGVKDGKYHIVSRWSPHLWPENELFITLCLFVVEMSWSKNWHYALGHHEHFPSGLFHRVYEVLDPFLLGPLVKVQIQYSESKSKIKRRSARFIKILSRVLYGLAGFVNNVYYLYLNLEARLVSVLSRFRR